jgi:glycosyltransferase involved in cell wall biosynthesis
MDDNLDSVPSLFNAVKMLAAAGYEVEIFTFAGNKSVAPSFDDGSVKVTTFVPRQARKGIHRLLPARYSYPLQAWRSHLTTRYCCFIGVDPGGLIRARSFTRLTRVPLAYYSLELLLSDELSSTAEREVKKKESSLSRNAPFVVIQDSERAQLLANDNQLSEEKFVFVPNAPLGPIRRNTSRFWHRRFNLPDDTRVVLHAGSLGDWTGIQEIAGSTWSWPENWVLVVHTRHDAEFSVDVEKLRKLAAPGRVLFSLKPVSRQEYDALIDGADIGVAFYIPTEGSTNTQRNIQSIGLSSGKAAYYLRSGVPVIVNDRSSIGEFVTRENCGVCVERPEDIALAITQIEQTYSKFRECSWHVFNKHFDFATNFEEVIRRIDLLDTPANGNA